MRLPRPRFTVGQLMVAILVVGLPLEIAARMARRSATLRAEAVRHGRLFLSLQPPYAGCTAGQAARETPGLYHYEMMCKYEQAARCPWLPIEPDPPDSK